MGEYDVVKEVLAELGTVWFGGVRMQPGKPQGFGHVGEDRTPIFALPGNPVSSYVSFQLFVLPALRRMMGRTPYQRPHAVAQLIDADPLVRGQAAVSCARVHDTRLAVPHVAPVGGHGSHLLGDLSVSNALVVVPEDTEEVEAGAMVDVLLLDRATSPLDEREERHGRRARLTHVDESGAARMVDVSAKDVTTRRRSRPAGCW